LQFNNNNDDKSNSDGAPPPQQLALTADQQFSIRVLIQAAHCAAATQVCYVLAL
jgi:hypothetical protein